MKKKNKIWFSQLFLIGLILIFSNGCKKDDNSSNTFTDIDGNVYHTITIGTQTWMVENLRTTHFNDSSAIPNVTDAKAWGALTTPGVCAYNNSSHSDTINTYGRLYNWNAIKTGKLAPTGWHVPTTDEWTILENYLISNGYNYDGTTTINSLNKIAKALAATKGWYSESDTGTIGSTDYPAKRNATGFTALPGGTRDSDGTFYDLGYKGFWWSSSEYCTGYAWSWFLSCNHTFVIIYPNDESSGISVRCLRD